MFLCGAAGCGYKSFSFMSIRNHDRRLHDDRQVFSIAFRPPGIGTYQPYRPVSVETMPHHNRQADQYPQEADALPGSGQRTAGNQPLLPLAPAEDVSCTFASESAQSAAESNDGACASVGLTADFQAIYRTFEQKINALKIDTKLFD